MTDGGGVGETRSSRHSFCGFCNVDGIDDVEVVIPLGVWSEGLLVVTDWKVCIGSASKNS